MRSFQAGHGALPTDGRLDRRTWTALLARGGRPVLKYGAAGDGVRRLQRALNAAGSPRLAVDGVFAGRTRAAVRAYQRRQDDRATGVVTEQLWDQLQQGRR